MAIERKDEVLEKVLETDDSVIPRFDIVLPNGAKVAENAEIILKNPVLQPGMPVNKVAMDECLAASGTTTGTNTHYLLEQPSFVFFDGATVRFKLHVDSGATPTLNINGTGAKALMQNKNKPMRAGLSAGLWFTATYSSTFDFFVLQGSGTSSNSRFGNDVGQISSYEMFMVGRGDPTYSRNF